MIFNSTTFAVFLVVFLIAYWRVVPVNHRNAALFIGSYVFYGWWDWRFLSLLALSTVVDFTVGQLIYATNDTRRRLRLLRLSLAINLGVLGIFKYSNFFVDSAISTAESIGVALDVPTVNVLLPVGISFYTFQTMSYTLDIYRRRLEPCQSFFTFATFVAYFPQLVAGPIERAQRLLPILENQTSREFPTGQRLNQACSLILVGLVKKVVLADGVARVVNDVYASPEAHSTAAIWIAVIGFSIQIYGDFAGYTDIARGVSALLGIDLIVNFREPYLSRNITEFWRRWHISLSDWLRDYLYISLGGNRHGQWRTLRNLMLTMLLGGLWHGASWNFVIWGGLHGLFLIVHKLTRRGNVKGTEPTVKDTPAMLFTFWLVSTTWIFFRAETFASAWGVFSGFLTWRSGTFRPFDAFLVLALALVALSIDLAQRRSEGIVRPKTTQRSVGSGVFAGALVAGRVVFSGGDPAPFIYFQF